MNSLFATSLSFGVRVLVDAVNPYSFRLGASVVGVCEGIILYHSRPGTSPFDPSLNPYVAYALRTVVDYLVSQSLVRMAIILLWTGLGLVLSDLIEASSRDDRHRPTTKSRTTRVRKSRGRPSDAPPQLYVNDQPAIPDVPLPTDFPDTISPPIIHPVPRPGDGAPYVQEHPSIGVLSEDDTYPDPFQGLPEFGRSNNQLPVVGSASRRGYTPPVSSDQPDRLVDINGTVKEGEHTPTMKTTELPAPIYPSSHNGDVLSPTKFTDQLVPTNNDAVEVEERPSSIPTTDQHPQPWLGALLTLAPDQTPVVPLITQSPIEIPISLPPDLPDAPPSTEEPQPFGGESIPPAINPTQPSLSLIVPAATAEGQLMTGMSSATFLPTTATENADPLPVRVVADINAAADTSNPQLVVPTPDDDPQTNPKKNSRWTRPTLTLKARSLREQAEAAFKESHRFEAERKQANQEGRKKDAILREGDRDEALERSKVLSDKAAKYYYLADNVDLPPQTIDVHHSDVVHAMRVIKDKYRQTLKKGGTDQQLRVIIGHRGISPNLKALSAELKRNRIPCTTDPADANVLILTLPP